MPLLSRKLANGKERFQEAAGTQLDIFDSFIGRATETWRGRRKRRGAGGVVEAWKKKE